MERRERKSFVPPPWERWDEAPERRESESRESEAARRAEEQPTRRSEGAAAEQEPNSAPGGAEVDAERPVADDKQVAAMLVQLKLEEPDTRRAIVAVRTASAAFLLALGAVMVLWSGAAFISAAKASSKLASWFGAGAIGLCALFFLATGAWLLAHRRT